ncbi:hypothetical protein YPPY10_2777, partial [Yersinia pestis PY-10]
MTSLSLVTLAADTR